jgi:hypothetical protein
MRMLKTPKSSLKMQKGTPMVRAWKVGVWKRLGSITWEALIAD